MQYHTIADVRFGDQVVWKSIDGKHSGLVVGFATEIGEISGMMVPFMLIKTTEVALPLRLCMSKSYLDMMDLKIVGKSV